MSATKEKLSPREIVFSVVAVVLVAFHLYTAGFGILTGYIQAPIHWALIATCYLLAKPSKSRIGKVLDVVVIAVTCYLSYHLIQLQDYLLLHPSKYATIDVVMSWIAVAVAIYLGYRVLGKVLPTICILFILYAYFGHYCGGLFQTTTFSLKRIGTYLYTMSDALYGSTLLVSAQYLLLFIFFGSVMEITGAGEFFVNVANAVAGRVRGGPAQAAVYSSMLMGMVNGSGAANVATTGTFTIPLMKKTGYHPAMAGAVEAVASSGGQIMPPVMGAVAFLMSETTGIPYAQIALAALVPAVLYYISLSVSVYGTARRKNMPKPDPATLPTLRETMKKGWFFLIPLLLLVYMIYSGKSAQRSVFWAIVAVLVVSLLFSRKSLTPKILLEACKKSAISCGPLALACMLAGVVMGMINLTGLGLKITAIIQSASHGNLLVALILAMLVGLLLGMGLPTSAAYVVLSVLIAPSLINMGVSVMAAHMFLLYFGALSSITPPVALSTFTAAGISGAGIWETGWEAMKLSAAGFIVPFVFCFSNELLLVGTPLGIVLAIVTAILGCAVLGFSVCGWCMVCLCVPIRLALLPCAIMLIMPKPLWLNGVGLLLAVLLVYLEIMRTQKANAIKN